MGTTIYEFPEGTNQDAKPTKSCGNCRFFVPYVYEFDGDEVDDRMDADFGECHRFPPTIRITNSEDESGFPIVENIQWCGEFDI